MRKIIIGLALAIMAAMPLVVAAAGEPVPQYELDLSNPTAVLNKVRDWSVAVIAGLSTLIIFLGAFKYMTSQGDETKATGAKNLIKNGILGMIIAMLAYGILTTVAAVFAWLGATPR